jgi:hypothetical protein
VTRECPNGADPQRFVLRPEQQREVTHEATLPARQVSKLFSSLPVMAEVGGVVDDADGALCSGSLERRGQVGLQDAPGCYPRVVDEPIDCLELTVGSRHLRERSSRICRRLRGDLRKTALQPLVGKNLGPELDLREGHGQRSITDRRKRARKRSKM